MLTKEEYENILFRKQVEFISFKERVLKLLEECVEKPNLIDKLGTIIINQENQVMSYIGQLHMKIDELVEAINDLRNE